VHQSFRPVWPGLVGGVQTGEEERAGEIVNQFHWMDGAYGVPPWLWLVAVGVGCLGVIFWVWALAIASAHRERMERHKSRYIIREFD
jgi:hypothetical protein